MPADGRQPESAGDIVVTVLLFARAREVAGVPALSLPLPSGERTPAGVAAALVARFPALREVLRACVLAVNQEYVSLDDTLQFQHGDEVAVVPPLSGG